MAEDEPKADNPPSDATRSDRDAERRRFVRSRERAGWVRRGLALLAILGVGAGIAVSWMPKPIPVDVDRATLGPLEVTVDEDGRTRVKDRYVVSAPLLANVARIELHPGDPVSTETVLARLVPLSPPLLDARSRAQAEGQVDAASAAKRQSSAAVKRVEAALAFAERDLKRKRGLTGSGAVPVRVVEQAELQVRSLSEELSSARFGTKVAAHQLQVARAALGRMGKGGVSDEQLEITSPVPGRVLKVIQRSEGAVQPGTPLLEVGDPQALEIVVDVLTSDAVHITPGTRVLIERWGGEHALAAHVRLVEPSAFSRVSALGVEEQRVNVVIDLDEPVERWTALGDGYRVEARIVVWRRDEVLRAPASSVFRHGDGWAVFRRVGTLAKLTPIEAGRRNALQIEVTSGLSDGDEVIVHPSDRVLDGVEVTER